MSKDSLIEIPPTDWLILRDLYEGIKHAPFMFSFVSTVIKWKLKKPDQDYIKMYGPANWKQNGTIIAVPQLSCYDCVVFSKTGDYDLIYKLLINTKKVDFKNNGGMVYLLHHSHYETVMKSLQRLEIPITWAIKFDIWWMPKEKARSMEIRLPPEVYINRLSNKDITEINDVWPFKCHGSDGYLQTLLDMGSAYGVFLKSDNTLVAWIFKVYLGTFGILQTKDGYQRKGYAGLVLRYISKEIGEEGHDPLGTVTLDNFASQGMMKKNGFEILDQAYYIRYN